MVGDKDGNKAENMVKEETIKTRKNQIDTSIWRYCHDLIHIKCAMSSMNKRTHLL